MEASREPVPQQIANANFSDIVGDKLRKDADLEKVLIELARNNGAV